MAKLRWVMIVERAIIEAETGNLSLISLIDQVRIKRPAAELPRSGKRALVPHRFSIVQYWDRTDPKKPERFKVRSRLFAPDKAQYAGIEHVVDLETSASCRVIGQAIGFPLHGEGAYPVQIEASKDGRRWRKVGEQCFTVVFTDGAPSPLARSRSH